MDYRGHGHRSIDRNHHRWLAFTEEKVAKQHNQPSPPPFLVNHQQSLIKRNMNGAEKDSERKSTRATAAVVPRIVIFFLLYFARSEPSANPD
jgi:hypothetical protein